MAVPAPTRFPECARGAAGPSRWHVQVRSHQYLRSSAPQIRAGHDGAGNNLADADGMDDCPGFPGHRPIQHKGRRPDYHRAPADFGAVGALVRIATCISGRVEAVVNCGPQFNYGAAGGTWSYKGDSYDAMVIAAAEGDIHLEVAGTIPLGVMGARCYGRTTLTEGQSAFVTLSWGGDHV